MPFPIKSNGRKIIAVVIFETAVLLFLACRVISAHHSGVYKTFDLSSFTSEYLNYSNDSWHADQEHDAADGVYEILSTPGIELKPGTYTVAVTADADYDQNGYVYTRNFMVPDGDYTKLTTFVVCHDIDTTYFRFQLEERSKVQFRIGYSGFGDLDVKGVSVSKSAIGPFLIFSYALIFFAIADLLFYHFAFVKEDKNQRALKVASSISFAAVCVVAFVSILVFLADKYDIINNSDIASQIVLAKECFKEHSLIARDWFYATEIRVLALQAIYALLFVFTNNWHMIRLIGNGIQYALLFFSFLFMCRGLKLKKSVLFIALLIFLPFTASWWSFVLSNPNYALFMTYSFFTIGAVTFSADSEKRAVQLTLTIAASVLALFAGMEGMRQLFICYVPLFLASALLLILDRRGTSFSKKLSWQNWYDRLFTFSFIVTAFACVGTLINIRYLTQHYYFLNYSTITWDAFSLTDLGGVFTGWLNNLGFESGRLMSMRALQNLCAVLISVITVKAILSYLSAKNAENHSGRFLAAFVTCGFVVCLALYSLTTMTYGDRYDMPITFMCFPLAFSYLSQRGNYSVARRIIMAFIMFGLTAGSVYNYSQYIISYSSRTNLMAAASYLVDHGYKNGYATFWYSNVLQELSNGKLDTWTWQDSQIPENVDQTYLWAEKASHETQHPDGKIFWIVADTEANSTIVQAVGKDYVVFRIDGLSIYSFDSYNDMVHAVYDQNYTYGDGNWLNGGEDANGVRTIHPGGSSFGPYTTLRKGKYTVTFDGSNLKRAEFDCIFTKNGIHDIEIQNPVVTDDHISYEIDLKYDTPSVECRVSNDSGEDVMLTGLHINPIVSDN